MSYDPPAEIRSPRAHWQLVEVISDGGPDGPAYALGTWDNERRVGFRWNGTAKNPRGNPQSRGLGTWTMLDPNIYAAVVSCFPVDKQAFARGFLGLPEAAELRVHLHPSGRRTLQVRQGRGMAKELGPPLAGNDDPARFYRAVAEELGRRGAAGEAFEYADASDL